MMGKMMQWLSASLRRKLIITIVGCLVTASLVFLLLFKQLYHSQLAQERSTASASINRLLQASLENAMLKQDLEGLRDIINRLGQQKDIKNAFIINPMQEMNVYVKAALNSKFCSIYRCPATLYNNTVIFFFFSITKSKNRVKFATVMSFCLPLHP